jgi:hypothetical protein
MYVILQAIEAPGRHSEVDNLEKVGVKHQSIYNLNLMLYLVLTLNFKASSF